jgi:tRNA pseudouridine38-40 synthase
MSQRHFRATVEYDGTDFSGFQWQHGERTVQGALEAALLHRTGQAIRLTGAGRTDAGVHAVGQVITFSAETRIPTDRIAIALNSALPSDVYVRSAAEVDPEFNARFSASSRIYGYVIRCSETRSPLWRRFSAPCKHALNVSAMQEAAAMLIGEQDFAAFANQLQPQEPTMRNVMRCSVAQHGRFVVVRIEANAFLRGMVRCIVGTLMQVGDGTRSPDIVQELIQSRDRRLAGPSAPAQGLCLLRVRYGERRDYRRTREVLSSQSG